MNAGDFGALGFDAIPLLPGSKEPACKGWQRLAPEVQWRNAPPSPNIGLRGGGDLHAAFLDCDTPETWETVRRWAAGLGYMPDGDYPLVATASGDGRHVYMRLADALPGHWKRLKRDFGKGELRFGPGSFVVAPGSVVGGCEYKLLAGDLRQLPRLERADLRDLVDVDALPVLRVADTPAIPRLAQSILRGDADVCGRYPSRSEAEAAAITALVNVGHDFRSVLELFQLHPCAGKYAELRQTDGDREALRWLRRTYDVQAAWTEENESTGRKVARAALAWAMSVPWPGRTGNSDRAVMLAHCQIAFRAGAITYAAAIRRLAELAGVNRDTAHKANRRLVEAGHVTLESGSFVTAAAVYALKVQSHDTSPQVLRGEVSQLCTSGDVWRFRGLGKSAAHVWATLRDNPDLSVAELAQATGRDVTTVRRAIDRMERIVDVETGEILRLVEAEGDGWRAVESDMDAIARAVGTAGAGARQRAKHQEERAGFERAIARAKAGTTPESAR